MAEPVLGPVGRAAALPTARARSSSYLLYLIVLMGLVAIMDQYISTIKTTAIPYIMSEYSITAAEFSWLEALYLVPTFLIFVLNGLNDIIGRRLTILVLVLLFALSSLAMVFLTPSLPWFMAFYAIATFGTVSNTWVLPVSEESPAAVRAKRVAIVYVIGLVPLQALLPPLLVDTLGLNWRWMYGAMFVFALPVLALWMFMRETSRFEVVRAERRAGARRAHFYGLGVLDRRDIRYIVLAAGIWMCWLLVSFFYYWAGYYFMSVKGFTLSGWSTVLLVTLLMAMLGGVTGGWIMDHTGRRMALVGGCAGASVSLAGLGFAPVGLLPIFAALSGYFISLSYSWIVVYIPEVFPTERRGSCMGWTTTIARVAYVAGPALAAVLLQVFPTMEWFWVFAGLVILLPVGIVLVLNPYETRTRELEEIEALR